MPLSVLCDSISRPMLQEGKSWVYDFHHFEELETNDVITYDESVYEVSYTLRGDTIIGGVTYAKLMRCLNDVSTYFAALREDGTTVLCVNAGTSDSFVLMEYDPAKFSSVPELYGNYTEYKEVVNVNGETFVRHVYEPSDAISGFELIAVEGIGFANCGLIQGMVQIILPCVCDYESFKACYEDERCIFTNEDFSKSTATCVRIDQHTVSSSLYDLQGRRLAGKPSKGVYIQGNKKRVVK